MFHKWIEDPESKDCMQECQDNRVLSVREWMAMLVITLIPVLNIIMLLGWAFANKDLIPANKVNWARATIILLTVIFITIGIVASFFFLGWSMQSH